MADEEIIDMRGKLQILVGLATNKGSLVPTGREFVWVTLQVWLLTRKELFYPYPESNPGFQVFSN